MLSCTLPIKTVSIANKKEHWGTHAKRTKKHRETAAKMLRSYGMPGDIWRTSFPIRWTITLTRIGGRTMDDDNLRSALKATRDGVADWLGIDDGDKRLVWQYGQEPKKGKLPPGVRVDIEATVDSVDVFPWAK